MKIKLEIPKKDNKNEIEKVYETEVYDLPFGIIDEVIATLDFEKLKDEYSLGVAILKNIKQIKPLMLAMFDGLTEEELGRIGVTKLIPIIVQIFVNAKDEITAEIKNVMMGLKK